MKKINNKSEKIIFLIAVFQILLLITLTPAQSYTIHQTDPSLNNNLVINEGSFGNKIKKLLGIGVNLLTGFLSIKEIGFVSAADLTTSCCPDTCSDVISTFTECNQELIPTTCANTDECRLGCCFDPVEGLCSTNSPKERCQSNGGTWSSDTTCSINSCKKGCCVIGSNAIFTTDQNCAELSQGQGVEKDFRQQIRTERECLALTASSFEGACVLSGRNCKFESEKQCLYDGGAFHQDYLCSNPELDTKCEKQKTIKCASGKDEIYWFDSCGNRENIYDSDKDKSWNDGKVLTKDDSCGGSDGIIGSTSCGNCKQALSTCSETTGTHVTDGNFICKDLGCKNAVANVGTQNRINGEKWCLYDGSIGDGKAVVGSEQWLAYCHNGNVSVERCGDYRGGLCEQQKIEDPTIPNGFTTAACVVNKATDCMSITQQYFGKDNLGTECNKNDQCMVKTVSPASDFKFSMCVPKYPKGNDLTLGVDGNGCSMANQKCAVVYEKVCNPGCHWDCKANCGCESSDFAKQMNELCMSIGDCGSNVNYLGKGTDNVKISGEKGKVLDSDGKETDKEGGSSGSAPSVYSWTHYTNNAKSVSGQSIGFGDVSQEVAVAFGINNYNIGNSSDYDIFGGIMGAMGGAAYLFAPGALTAFGLAAATVTPYCYAAAAIFAGMALGEFLGKALNKSPGVILSLIIAGGVLGAGVAAILLSGTYACSGGPWGCIIGGIVAIVVAIIFILWTIFTGNGDRETRYVEFTCQPWTAPNGGDNCEKCNNDPLRPCTAYRCSSLGQLCILKNENEQNPICYSLPKETNPPVISAGEVSTDEYSFQNDVPGTGVGIVKSDGSEQGCIHEFTPLAFTLKTDEYAQCKYSFKKPNVAGYDQMVGEYPVEENLFEKNHTFWFRMPGIDDANIYDPTQQPDANGSIVKYGKLSMYVKCQDGQNPPNYNVKEYVVNMCVNSGPDLTPVSFAEAVTTPENGAVLKFGTTEKDLKFLINEPANCKYDNSEGKNYDDMQYSMDCKTSISDSELGGWPCTTKVQNLIPGNNKFYFKCKDMSGNINEEDFVYTLKVSEKELKIDSVNLMYGVQKINFEGELRSGIEPVSVNLEIKTSGGGYDGKSYCLWGVSAIGNRWMMTPFGNSVVTHNQVIAESGGSHNIYIDCQDDAGNEVSISGGFTVSIDSLPPVIIRAYKDGGNVKVFTDELARCYYNKNTCTFDLNDTSATPMTTSYSKVHTAPWSPGTIYYIRCRDNYGNVAACTGGISPS